jgi:NADH-quinone oxidoreductase subunit M
MLDLSPREMWVMAPLVALVIFYGVRPGVILDAFAAPTEALLKSTGLALGAVKAAALMAP